MIWINPEFLEWQPYSGGGTELSDNSWLRAYEIWSHAERRLIEARSELDLVDVITTLKRSIDQRVRTLDRNYSFAQIPIRDKPSDTLSLLEFFGLVRPLMFRKLLEIRNVVEHEDGQPPDADAAQIFVEFTWYFLKSTDRLLQIISSDVHFQCDTAEEKLWMEVSYGPSTQWNPLTRGQLSCDLISHQAKEGWLTLSELSGPAFIKQSLGIEVETAIPEEEEQTDSDYVYVRGSLRGPNEGLLHLTRIYFSAA